ADTQLLAVNLRCVDNPARHHGAVGKPVGELNLTRLLVEAVSQIGAALLTKPLQGTPQVRVLDIVPLDPKVVRANEPELHRLLDEPLTVRVIQNSLDHLRSVHVLERPRPGDVSTLEPSGHVAAEQAHIRAIRTALGVDLVLQFAEEYGPPLIGLRAVLAKRRVDGNKPSDPQQRHVLAVNLVQRRILAPRSQGRILPPVEQAQLQRRDRLVVGLADYARCDPRRDIHPFASAVHPYTDAISPRRDDSIWHVGIPRHAAYASSNCNSISRRCDKDSGRTTRYAVM